MAIECTIHEIAHKIAGPIELPSARRAQNKGRNDASKFHDRGTENQIKGAGDGRAGSPMQRQQARNRRARDTQTVGDALSLHPSTSAQLG